MNLTEVDLKHYVHVLPNGLTVVSIEMPHIHSLEISMFVRAGLRFEDEKDNGISHFIEHMLFRGNKKYPTSLALNKEFETIGRELRASTLSEYTHFGFSPSIAKLDEALQLFANFFTDPTFSEIDLEREIILEEYQEELNENGENIDIDNLACQILYPGNPLAWPTVGTRETLESINTEDLRDYFNRHYVPGNLILASAGPISHAEFLRLAERYFSELGNQGKVISPDYFLDSIVENQSEEQILFQHDSDSQIQLQVCFRSLSYNDPDFYIACMISRIFDDGFTSRLQRALREDRGLVYSVECRATSLSDVGTMDFDVSVRPEKIRETCRILLDEIKKIAETGPAEEELAHFKQRYLFDFESDLDDPYKQVVRYAFPHLYSKTISVEEEVAIIEAITTKDILEVAKRIFVRKNLNVVVVGPYTSTNKSELEEIVRSF